MFSSAGAKVPAFCFGIRHMSLLGKTAIVIGGGIGGLAVARALALRGVQVTVLEQAPEIREVGAGLQISPNGFAVLKGLGLHQALAARAVQARAVSLRDYRRGEVLHLDLTRLRDQNYYFIHRADLIEALAAGTRDVGVQVRLNQKVELVVPGRLPYVDLADGSRLQADLIVGADGLHSVLRPALNKAANPFFTGQVAWRALVPNHQGRGPEAWVHMAPGRHLVSYPLRKGSVLNIVAVQERAAWREEGWHHPDDPANLRAAFADFGDQAQQMLAAVEEVHCWGLFRHQVAEVWQRENCALLGDAAHPTLPFLAQGASMALEDTWALVDELAKSEDIGAGLAAYEHRRQARATRVINAASNNAWKYHLRNWPIRKAAHLALRVGGTLAPGLMLHQFDWLYDHDETAQG